MDKIFKIGLLVLGFSYLAYLFCPIANQTGRYQYHTSTYALSVFDTSTGLIYRCPSEYIIDVGGGKLDIVEWGKDQTRQLKEFQKLEYKEFIEKLRKEGIEIKETN